eukprot:1992182-Rhodomonas_salina.1
MACPLLSYATSDYCPTVCCYAACDTALRHAPTPCPVLTYDMRLPGMMVGNQGYGQGGYGQGGYGGGYGGGYVSSNTACIMPTAHH